MWAPWGVTWAGRLRRLFSLQLLQLTLLLLQVKAVQRTKQVSSWCAPRLLSQQRQVRTPASVAVTAPLAARSREVPVAGAAPP